MKNIKKYSELINEGLFGKSKKEKELEEQKNRENAEKTSKKNKVILDFLNDYLPQVIKNNDLIKGYKNYEYYIPTDKWVKVDILFKNNNRLFLEKSSTNRGTNIIEIYLDLNKIHTYDFFYYDELPIELINEFMKPIEDKENNKRAQDEDKSWNKLN